MSAEIIHGDCLDVMRGMPDASFDAVITDPPYGMGYASSWTTHRITTRKIANDASFDPDFHIEWLREANRLTRDGGAIYAFIDDQHLGDLRACAAGAGWKLKRSMVWLKDSWTVGDLSGDYGHQTEFVVYAHKGRHILNGPRESNVLRFPRVPPDKLLHPAQKPAPLLAYLVRKSTPIGGLVLDPFAGVASCGVGTVSAERRYTGIESDDVYIPVARRRLDDALSQIALPLGAA